MTRDTYTQSQTTKSSSTFHTYTTTQSSQSGSICDDTIVVLREPQRKVSSMADKGQGAASRGQRVSIRGKGGSGRGGGSGRYQCGTDREGGSSRGQCGTDMRGEEGTGRGQRETGRELSRKIANARGTPFKSGKNVSSSQVPPLPTTRGHTVLPHLLLLLDTKGL